MCEAGEIDSLVAEVPSHGGRREIYLLPGDSLTEGTAATMEWNAIEELPVPLLKIATVRGSPFSTHTGTAVSGVTRMELTRLPTSALISVLFPAPLGPSKATTSPRPTVRFTPCSTSIDPYEARTLRSSRIGVLTTGLRGKPVKHGGHVECSQGCHER